MVGRIPGEKTTGIHLDKAGEYQKTTAELKRFYRFSPLRSNGSALPTNKSPSTYIVVLTTIPLHRYNGKERFFSPISTGIVICTERDVQIERAFSNFR